MKSNIFDCIIIPKNFFIFTGVWPIVNASLLYRLNRLSTFVTIIVFNITILMEMAKVFRDYEAVSALASTLASTLSYIVKLVLFAKYKKEFLYMLNFLEDPIFTTYDDDLDVYIQKINRRSKILGRLYQSFCTCVISLYSLVPFFNKNEMPVPFTYYSGALQYWLICIFQIHALASTAGNNCGLDLLSTGLMDLASAQFRILAKKIERATSESELKMCIKHHIAIIKYVDQIEYIFTWHFMAQFADSILVICCIGFQLANAESVNVQFMKFIFYFMTMMFQLALYCWYGNEVMETSLQITNACYSSKWHECGPKFKKLILIVMERAKRPSQLTAAKLSTLSLVSFTAVIRSSYSYFALLQRLYNEDLELE